MRPEDANAGAQPAQSLAGCSPTPDTAAIVARHRPAPKQIDWRFTIKVRQAVAEGRYIISAHVADRIAALGLSTNRLVDVVATGVVLPRREKDETGQATDGYKHFLLGVAPSGDITEVVLKFVSGTQWPGEDLVILITAYRGKA